MLLAIIISKLFFHYKVIQILPKHQHEEIQESNWFLNSKSWLEQLKIHKNTWHKHSAITFTYFIKTKKFQKEKCRESCHEQLSFTTYKQKTKGSRAGGKNDSRPDLEKERTWELLVSFHDLSGEQMKALPLLSMAAALSHTLLGCGSLFTQDIERRKSKAQDSSLSFHTHTHVDKHAIGCHKCFLLLSMQGTQYNYICESIRFNPENYETCAKVMSPDQISQFFGFRKRFSDLKLELIKS